MDPQVRTTFGCMLERVTLATDYETPIQVHILFGAFVTVVVSSSSRIAGVVLVCRGSSSGDGGRRSINNGKADDTSTIVLRSLRSGGILEEQPSSWRARKRKRARIGVFCKWKSGKIWREKKGAGKAVVRPHYLLHL